MSAEQVQANEVWMHGLPNASNLSKVMNKMSAEQVQANEVWMHGFTEYE